MIFRQNETGLDIAELGKRGRNHRRQHGPTGDLNHLATGRHRIQQIRIDQKRR
jgi:hypothetical protein